MNAVASGAILVTRISELVLKVADLGRVVSYAFHVDDIGFDATVARLEMHGLPAEIHDFRAESRGRAVYVADPAGNVLEFWTLDVSAETEVGS